MALILWLTGLASLILGVVAFVQYRKESVARPLRSRTDAICQGVTTPPVGRVEVDNPLDLLAIEEVASLAAGLQHDTRFLYEHLFLKTARGRENRTLAKSWTRSRMQDLARAISGDIWSDTEWGRRAKEYALVASAAALEAGDAIPRWGSPLLEGAADLAKGAYIEACRLARYAADLYEAAAGTITAREREGVDAPAR